MQNYYENPVQRVGNEFRERFDDFFLANAFKSKTKASYVSMPDFQKQLFINKAIDNNLQVTLEMVSYNSNGQTSNASGTLSKISGRRFLLKHAKNVSYFIDFNQIKYISLRKG